MNSTIQIFFFETIFDSSLMDNNVLHDNNFHDNLISLWVKLSNID